MIDSSPQKPSHSFGYWLIVESERLNHEYGLNDVSTFEETEGGSHYFELPSDMYLKNGLNSAFIRMTPAPDTPEITENKDKTKQPEKKEDVLPVFAKISIEVMKLKGRSTDKVLLMTIRRNPHTGEFKATPGPAREMFTIKTGYPVEPLPSDKDQGMTSGFKISFHVNDTFDPLPFLGGQTLTLNPALEKEVKAAMAQLFKRFQSRDYEGVVKAFDLSWRHIAIQYDYGKTAREYADAVGFEGNIKNPDYEFILDYSKSKLRIQGDGKLVGFYPPVIMGQEPNGFVAVTFQMFFMRRPNGLLRIGG